MSKLVLFVSPVSTHGSEGNHARLLSLVEAVRTLGFETFLCLIDIPAFDSQRPSDEFKAYWKENYLYKKAGWHLDRSTWTLPVKGLVLVVLQRLLRKFVSPKNALFRRLLGFQFCYQWTPKEFKGWLKEFASIRNPCAVICEYAVMAGTLPANPTPYIRIIDTHDVFTDRNKKLGYEFNWINLDAKQEKQLLDRADHVFAIQQEETAFFVDFLKVRAKVSTLDIITATTPGEARFPPTPVIGYLASRNPINLQSIKWFITGVWPEITRRVPGARLKIAGTVGAVLDIQSDDIELTGFAQDLKAFYDSCTCIINPALNGTGLKIKTIEALMNGKPVISTREGASGLQQWVGQGFYTADTAEQFSELCIQVLTNTLLAKSLSDSAKALINGRCETNLNLLKEILESQDQAGTRNNKD